MPALQPHVCLISEALDTTSDLQVCCRCRLFHARLQAIIAQLAQRLQGVAMQKAHQPREEELELSDFLLFLWVFAAEAKQVAESIEPLSTNLLKQRHTFPEA